MTIILPAAMIFQFFHGPSIPEIWRGHKEPVPMLKNNNDIRGGTYSGDKLDTGERKTCTLH